MDELQWLDINRKLDIIIAQTRTPGQSPWGETNPIPSTPPPPHLKQWEIKLARKNPPWTKEQFATQIKQREPGWPESLVALAGCWSLEGGASQALVDMIAESKDDNQELFVK